jgi:hypothetical protein
VVYYRKGVKKVSLNREGRAMEKKDICANAPDLVSAFARGIEEACSRIDFDVQCLDWFSYTPDFFIDKKNVKAA